MPSPLNYKIIGETAQLLEIDLEPDAIIIADAGALLYIDEEIEWETRPDDGADEVQDKSEEDAFDEDEAFDEEEEFDKPSEDLEEEEDFSESIPPIEEEEKDQPLIQKLFSAGKKLIQNVSEKIKPQAEPEQFQPEDEPFADDSPNDLFSPSGEDEENAPEEAGENWYITHFSNQSEYIRKIAFTTSNSGVVLPIDLNETLDNEIIVQTGRFMCARKGVHIEKFMDTDISVSFVQEKFYNLDILQGKGLVFLQAEGHVVEKSLDNDAISISLFSLIAFESSLEIDLNSRKKMAAMWHEESNIVVQLIGSGRFWIQTANVQHLVYRISPFIFEPPSAQESSKQAQQGAFEFSPEPEPHPDSNSPEPENEELPQNLEDALMPPPEFPDTEEQDEHSDPDEESEAGK